jgi:hypothetical protein
MNEIEKLREIINAASPGPWEARAVDGNVAIAGAGGWVLEGDVAPAGFDAHAIAAMRNIISELLAVAEAHQKVMTLASQVDGPHVGRFISLQLQNLDGGANEALLNKIREVLSSHMEEE